MPNASRAARLVGCAAIVGAILWPVALADLAATAGLALVPASTPIAVPRPLPIVPLGISLLSFVAVILVLELRAVAVLKLADLIGDLNVATAAAVFLLAGIVGEAGLLGPGFVVLFVGSVIFGVAGLDGRRRPRWGSALIGSGAGGLLACLFAVGLLGPTGLAGVTEVALLSVLLYSAGWAWLGVHLALARPLAPPA